ncbi:hypothetical protein [Geminisphaera colitermitum]|uniref:hypothetical protein n=1 Tax=Geminisphaera colitermitum TaxID=1148786 RepID=UPI000158C612|nr:hypothetical protein [Geminisphaera colitermitum]
MPGLEPEDIIRTLHDDLQPFVKEHGGRLSVADDPWNFLELLAEKPTGWRCVLHWAGDNNTQDHPLAGCILDNQFAVGITCQKGLSANPQEQLYKPRAGGAPSLLRLVALTRARVRSYVFPNGVSNRYVMYHGAEPVTLPDGTPLQGYRLRFSITATPEPVTYRNT